MAASITIKVDGLQELAQAMKKLDDLTQKKVVRSMGNAGAQLVKRDAVARAPEDTGLLKANIVVVRLRRTNLAVEYAVMIRRVQHTYANTKANIRAGKAKKIYLAEGPAYYGRFIEFGTVKMAPRPFLRPALEGNIGAATRAMVEAGRKAIAKAVGEIPVKKDKP